MDAIFDWCVDILVVLANQLGITYQEINVWVFVIIWPIITLILVMIIWFQKKQIQRLKMN